MVGELSAAMPEEGGFYVWVRRAMGPFWGFQEAWLSLVASIFDMAIYPSLFVAYLGKLFPAATVGGRGIAIAAGLIVLCLLWNLMGAKAVAIVQWLRHIVAEPFRRDHYHRAAAPHYPVHPPHLTATS